MKASSRKSSGDQKARCLVVIKPDGRVTTSKVTLSKGEIDKIVKPHLDGAVPQLIKLDAANDTICCEMYVDDVGKIRALPVNHTATEMVRRTAQALGKDPGKLPRVKGTAVLLCDVSCPRLNLILNSG